MMVLVLVQCKVLLMLVLVIADCIATPGQPAHHFNCYHVAFSELFIVIIIVNKCNYILNILATV